MKDLLEAIRADDRAAARRSISRWPEFAAKPQVVLEAARFARAEILELLLDAGADPNAPWRSYRPIHAVIQAEPHAERLGSPTAQLDCLERLLAHGVELELAGSWLAVRPLLLAAFSGERELVARLLDAGAKQDLFTDAALGKRASVEKALARDPELARARDASTFTALAAAAASRLGKDDAKTAKALLALATALLDHGADPNAEVRERTHLLPVVYFAIGAGQRDLLELLLARGADPTRAFEASFFRDSREWAELALARGAKLDLARHDGKPLLNELVRWGRVEEALWLIEKGVDLRLRGADGWTALHQAASRGNKRLFVALLAAGADRDAKDDHGLSVLDLARVHRRRELVALLQESSGASPRKRTKR